MSAAVNLGNTCKSDGLIVVAVAAIIMGLWAVGVAIY